MMKYNYITIEGNIGAGKTTLCNMLARDFNGKLILEQFADNPFLPLFYKNPRQYAFPLELFFLAERYQQLKDIAAAQDLFSSFTVTDYLFAKSHLFASINLVEEEFRLFKRLSQIVQASLPEPELLLYLHSPVSVILSNIAKRGRPYEKDITGDYLAKIQQVYFDYFRSQPQLRIVILDVSKINFIENKNDYHRIINVLQEEYPVGTTMISL
ncbi:MAG TPA: deoxynucleoside kinase [Chitinophagales bacterium]|nr:deoxynucleoside kinase [Chitinophagales bacterium]